MADERTSKTLEFHKGTEDALADYVVANATQGDPEAVIKSVDDFCWQQHWMMHVGNEKGAIVDNIIKRFSPRVLLELGTYCGYSATRFARLLPENGKLFTVDIFAQPAARRITQHAGVANKIHFSIGKAEEVLPRIKQIILTEANSETVDLVFIDHSKKDYLPDLLRIEQAGLLRSGSVIVADNVVVFGINDFLQHIQSSGKYSNQEMFYASLEYDKSNKHKDGVSVSTYN
eukprot:TRINITY_DN708_c1_g1_i1.p1 TRINITY_DN708_c1_g1~~TRINITY_DN708_c1_g1_i1.p1  ORF type:complete len:231 (-),score=108.62 TRINITY_DN708_c1_g1_i1:880-1572(-)